MNLRRNMQQCLSVMHCHLVMIASTQSHIAKGRGSYLWDSGTPALCVSAWWASSRQQEPCTLATPRAFFCTRTFFFFIYRESHKREDLQFNLQSHHAVLPSRHGLPTWLNFMIGLLYDDGGMMARGTKATATLREAARRGCGTCSRTGARTHQIGICPSSSATDSARLLFRG